MFTRTDCGIGDRRRLGSILRVDMETETTQAGWAVSAEMSMFWISETSAPAGSDAVEETGEAIERDGSEH